MADQKIDSNKPKKYESVFIEGGCQKGPRNNSCLICKIPAYSLTKDKLQLLFAAINDISRQNGNLIIYRDLNLVKTVVECASAQPAIQCHRGDFDPAQVGEMEVNGEKYPHAGWLVSSLTHIDNENMKILLDRVHAKRGSRFGSGLELIITLEKNMLNVSISQNTDSVTLDYRSSQEKTISHEGGNTGVKYTTDDLLKPENKTILADLKTLIPKEKRLEIFDDPTD
ncbi:MAG: hypothetical protein NT051_04170 [Candidatus Micrarchaeota archaeon]|nr:hypothetical protein [Candidatus Micrarchaeota archaeon]